MQIVTVQFNYEGGPDYKLLLDVFRESCSFHQPEAKFVEYRIAAPEQRAGRALNFKYNTTKLEVWVNHLAHTDEDTIFADCDMMMNHSAKHAFDTPFDVAYTQRSRQGRIPMNGGIVMVRPNEASRGFFKRWLEVNNDMLDDRAFHERYSIKWAGMNQSAFGYLFDHPEEHHAKLHEYLTREWNAVDCDWGKVTEDTVFIHYKSQLRKMILSEACPTDHFKMPMMKWYEMRARLECKS
jgi:hypothetical protein